MGRGNCRGSEASGEAVGVRHWRVRAENARALVSLVRGFRLWGGGAGLGDSEADAARRGVQQQAARAAAASPELLATDVGGGLTLVELLAHGAVWSRVAAWSRSDRIVPEMLGQQSTELKARTYRRPKEWHSWCVDSEVAVSRQVFSLALLWPRRAAPSPSAAAESDEIHSSAVGIVEERLQALARVLCPDGRALMGAGWLTWHPNDQGWMSLALGAIGASAARLVLAPAPSTPPGLEELRAAAIKNAPSRIHAELELELANPRLRRALEQLLTRTDELRARTPPLPHRHQPRGSPAWLPELSKATHLYPEVAAALAASREWQWGGGVGVVWAWLRSLARAGPMLRRPLDEAPLRVGGVALLLVPRTGGCAVLDFLQQHGTAEVRAMVAALPGNLRQRPGLMHAHSSSAPLRLAVVRAPLEAMASLLRLHVEAQWSADWQRALGLADAAGCAHGSPGALAAALLQLLDAADAGAGAEFGTEARLQWARGRVLRELSPLWRCAKDFQATMVIEYDAGGAGLCAALTQLGWLREGAPHRIPRRHESRGGGGELDEVGRAAVGRLCQRLGW